MESMRKKIFKELEMQYQTGRILRNMSLISMLPFESGSYMPPVDIYEGDEEIYVYFDLAGVDSKSLSVLVDDKKIRVSGRRELFPHKSIARVHRLEIELGRFSRSVSLPSSINIDQVTSTYKNGLLVITMPKKQQRGKINVMISADI